MLLPRDLRPGTWQPWESAAGLHQCPPAWGQKDRQQHALPPSPMVRACPGLPDRALPGGGQADSHSPLPGTQRLAWGRCRLSRGGGCGQGGLLFPGPSTTVGLRPSAVLDPHLLGDGGCWGGGWGGGSQGKRAGDKGQRVWDRARVPQTLGMSCEGENCHFGLRGPLVGSRGFHVQAARETPARRTKVARIPQRLGTVSSSRQGGPARAPPKRR